MESTLLRKAKRAAFAEGSSLSEWIERIVRARIEKELQERRGA
jgi:predicted HicB family RNase H-like nuclease